MERVSLYHYKSVEISISIEAYFEEDNLVIDGYDIGSRAKEYWGDSDYEYLIKIPPPGVAFLYAHFTIPVGNKTELLKALAARYNTNSCYSAIRELLDDNAIRYEGFTWT